MTWIPSNSLTSGRGPEGREVLQKIGKQKTESGKCVVCGANVKRSRRRRREVANRSTDTCDPVCTRAKHAGRSREEQFWADDHEAQKRDADQP